MQQRYDIANDDYDSDFDDEDFPSPQSNQNIRFPTATSQSANSNLPPIPGDHDTQSMTSSLASNRKSSKIFSKSSDAYIMGNSTPSVSESEQVHIYLNERGFYYWMPNDNKYTVTVTSPKMESKFKGIKKFIAYQLLASFSNEPVSRRYKNFDWLHERLSEKYVLIPIPPLPDKQISGRYEEQFIEHRRAQLQRMYIRAEL
jgi:sorting nexin-9/18/33